jgi:hypothetical protein
MKRFVSLALAVGTVMVAVAVSDPPEHIEPAAESVTDQPGLEPSQETSPLDPIPAELGETNVAHPGEPLLESPFLLGPPAEPEPETVRALTNEVVVVPVIDPEIRQAVEALGPAVDLLAARLGTLEQSLAVQHQRTTEIGQNLTRTVLIVAGCFAVAVLLGSLMAAVILARAVQRVSEVVVAALPSGRGWVPGRAIEGGESFALAGGPADGISPSPLPQVSERFLSAMERLEKRVIELEQTAAGTGASTAPPAGGDGAWAPAENRPGGIEFSVSALNQKLYGGAEPLKAEPSAGPQADPHTAQLGKGQALLNAGQVEEALACFDQVLAEVPGHAEALVKRGVALERLERVEAALESYSRAIEADGSMMLAYLHKGAVCNRLQRFREALDCYENALRCEQRAAGG